MSNPIEFAADILENDIDGFHRYCFAAPVHLDYVSRSLCEMTGCSAEELLSVHDDGYLALVHPEDRELYLAFLSALAAKAQRLTLQYRLICQSGTVIHVQDSMRSRIGDDGVMYGCSTLCDVTAIKRENEALHELSETVPCGILKYTCAETPRVTYVNEQMLRILRFSENISNRAELLDQYRQNIYLFISPEERSRFRSFLQYVSAQDKPIAGETTALRCDGTRVRLYGWISKSVNSDGEEEFQSVCMDVTERYERKRRREEKQYLHVLTQVYDEISEFDLMKKSIRFLHGHYCNRLGNMAGMPLVLEDALSHWISSAVLEEDRDSVRAVFRELLSRDTNAQESAPLQTRFRARFSDNTVRSYHGIFLRTNGSTYLFCCRNITQQVEADRLKMENTALRDFTEHIQELVMRFTDGMLAFEIRGSDVRPLYFSENICRFFGYTREEWLSITKTMTPIQSFVSKCHIPYEVFLELLEGRDGEFQFMDAASQTLHRYKAIRTAPSDSASASSYVMLYDVTDRSLAKSTVSPVDESQDHSVYIRTFGYFDVFVDGNPIAFRNEKSKELFALLTDRRGGFVTSAEAIADLWEDEPANPVTLARYRKVALRLKNTLEEYGIADIIESIDGKRRIVAQRVGCDLFDYLSGDPQHAQLFKGSYLQNYSWGERTLAELCDSSNV